MEAIDIFSYFLLLGLLLSAARVVTTSNVIHAAVALVFTLTITAVIFLLLSAEFVGLVIVMVYIGAVIVLFLSWSIAPMLYSEYSYSGLQNSASNGHTSTQIPQYIHNA